MRKSRLLLAFAVLLPLLLTNVGCSARVLLVPDPPPPLRVEVRGRAPGVSWVWRSGHWRNRHGHYVWSHGKWVRPPRGKAVWRDGHWTRRRGGWVWIEGSWR